MSASLDSWQERLDRHFAALAASRPVGQFPVFALEHGLDGPDLAEIGELLRARLAAANPAREYSLLWIIYATEFGYGYYGDEYWHSYEQQTPHWRSLVARDELRGWFLRFQSSYHGVTPSGPWAEHFSIIAWPITHAILPRYLQLQFVQALYAARHRLARIESFSASTLGELLANSAWDASSRFREFLQQEELAGRIALALLDQGFAEQSPIYPPTLDRLVSDLERVRRAREWLRETRSAVADHFKGTASRRSLSPSGPELQHHDARSKQSAHDIRPVLLLQRSSQISWSPIVIIPSFTAIAELDSQLSTFLKATRCRIAAVSDTWLPGSWLLSGPQRRVLKSWPATNAPVLAFERSHGVLQNLLDSECRISAGPQWLFRINADGTAREVTARIVRPGQSYVLVTQDSPLIPEQLQTGSCTINCKGATASILTVPEALSAHQLQAFQQIGLQARRTIRIWPAGLCGRSWDGEGHSEWLTTEAPCFGIANDHPVDEYLIGLDPSMDALSVRAGPPGQPVFIELPTLPPGRHVLSVKARRRTLAATVSRSFDAEGFVTLDVRDPRPWVPGTTSFAGLTVALDPPTPDLDTFWEGRVNLSVLGPEAQSVTCSVTLLGAHDDQLSSSQIGNFTLPIEPATWSPRFHRFASSHLWDYLEASKAMFIEGDDLGRFALSLERDFKPLRWICRYTHRTTTVRLIDDTGLVTPPSVGFCTFQNPLDFTDLEPSLALAGFPAEAPGGLFVAIQGAHTDAFVLSAPQTENSLQALLVNPRFFTATDDLNNAASALASFYSGRTPM